MRHLSSEKLLAEARSLVEKERRVTMQLIECLQEIERRRLYAEIGYTSMWDFARRYLGLSEGAAQRRIDAARLVTDAPEAKESLLNGKLSLSNAAQLQVFRRAEKKLGRKSDAHMLVERAESLSQNECLKVLFEISPEALPKERERIVSAQEERELKIVVSAELYEKLQHLKGLLAHALPDATYAELLDRMADETLQAIEKKKGISCDAEATATAALEHERLHPLTAGVRVALPAVIERAVWARGKGRCEVVHGGKRCVSRYLIQIDHIIPLAVGGSNEFVNLRLACWACNQQQALEKLGKRSA
jgi:hypothetical protein